METFEPEVLLHTYGQQCNLCVRKWLQAQPQAMQEQIRLENVMASCQAKEKE